MRIEIQCPRCGGNHFSLDDAHHDDKVVACGDCGRVIGTLESLKDEVSRLVLGSQRR